MATEQNKQTRLDSAQDPQLTLMWGGRKAFCRVPQRQECLFILHLILFSEHLLQVEEQKYSQGSLLRGHRGSWSWIRGKLPVLGGSRSTPRQPGVVTDDTEGAKLNPILYLPAARTAAVFRGRALLNPVSWREKPADLSSLWSEGWSQSRFLFWLLSVRSIREQKPRRCHKIRQNQDNKPPMEP